MNTTELKGNWNEQEAKLKQKFEVLTGTDLVGIKPALLIIPPSKTFRNWMD